MTPSRSVTSVLILASALWGSSALADAPPAEPRQDTGNVAPVERVPTSDPTGGAYTSPTLLFIPAGAMPVWNVRATVSTELQSPSDVHAGFRPGLGVELGLPVGFTVAAGTNWVGGDINP